MLLVAQLKTISKKKNMQHCNSQQSTVNCQLVVIADDITGAAEIAGIGLRFGLRVQLVMYKGEDPVIPPGQYDMLVFATDTRSMTQAEAIEETIRIAHTLKNIAYKYIFKKTDSALRGHITAELKTLMDITGADRSLLLPQNPSRGRTIEKGKYYINNTPLNKTAFAKDPEFPATMADVKGILYYSYRVQVLSPKMKIKNSGIYIAEATTPEDVEQRAGEVQEGILPAGGADFFTAYLKARGYTTKNTPPFNGIKSNHSLIVLGSTSNHDLSQFAYIQSRDIVECNVPRIIFYRDAPQKWIKKLEKAYLGHDSLILSINHQPQKGREIALNVREGMATGVVALLSERLPQELIIEGGATAFSILKRTNWDIFKVEQEVTPGVIRMTPLENQDITVTLKPGSYPWGGLFQ